jgi:branched-chain amino acid transport system ATP-binding protein
VALLEVRGIQAYYGSSHVLFGISLSIEQGEVVALLGRNGAGKTTTLKSIMGLVPHREGSVRFRDRELGGREPYEICRLGLGYVPEGCRIFRGLTVRENLDAARRPARQGLASWDEGRVFALFPQLCPLADRRAESLSGGEQRMLAVARTLMGNPQLLLLDEPSEGLAPLVVQMLLRQLLELKRTAVTIFLSEQNLKFATRLADRVYIIDKGEIKYSGTPAELAADEGIRRMYLMV